MASIIPEMDLLEDFSESLADLSSIGPEMFSLESLDELVPAAGPAESSPLTAEPLPSPVVTTELVIPKASPLQKTSMLAPRLVSVESMSHLRSMKPKKAPTETPYDSLKNLVKSKKTEAAAAAPKRTSDQISTFNLIPDDFQMFKPSSFLRQALHGKVLEDRAPKRRKVEDMGSQLHSACSRAASSEIERLLQMDQTAAARPATLMTQKSVYDPTTCSLQTKTVKESYSYPLNLAIQSRSEAKTIEKLACAAPQVLATPDGREKESSLAILLKNTPKDLALVDMMLLKNPKCASLVDRHLNTPLHIACSKGASVDVIRHLCILYPEALKMRNKNGHTPLDLAKSTTTAVCDRVASYVFEKVDESVHNLPL